MPLYHFNLADHYYDPDTEGTELADDVAARLQAITFAGDYLGDNPQLLDKGQDFRVIVTDDDAQELFTVKIELIAGS